MNLREKFLLDLRGYLVVRDFLTAEEVSALNAAVDVRHARHARTRARTRAQTVFITTAAAQE